MQSSAHIHTQSCTHMHNSRTYPHIIVHTYILVPRGSEDPAKLLPSWCGAMVAFQGPLLLPLSLAPSHGVQ